MKWIAVLLIAGFASLAFSDDFTYKFEKTLGGLGKVTKTTTFVKPSDQLDSHEYASLASLNLWLQEIKDQKTRNDTSRTSAAAADKAEVDRRQAIYDSAVAAGLK